MEKKNSDLIDSSENIRNLKRKAFMEGNKEKQKEKIDSLTEA